jgi:hypothetical protein
MLAGVLAVAVVVVVVVLAYVTDVLAARDRVEGRGAHERHPRRPS